MRRSVARALLPAIVASALLPAGAHTGAAGRRECPSLVAPAQTDCTTDIHDATNWYDIGVIDHPVAVHGVLRSSNYWGTLESRLEWPATNPLLVRVWRCDIATPGAFPACTGEGPHPPPSVDFRHSCTSFSYRLNTRGGSGVWSCYVDHDGPPPGGVPAGGIPDA